MIITVEKYVFQIGRYVKLMVNITLVCCVVKLLEDAWLYYHYVVNFYEVHHIKTP